MKLLDLVEVPQERGDRIGGAQKRQGQFVTLALVGLEPAGAAIDDSSREQLRIAKGVRDPVRGQGVLEIAGITDESPACAMTLSEVAWRSCKAPQTTGQCGPANVGAQFGKV